MPEERKLLHKIARNTKQRQFTEADFQRLKPEERGMVIKLIRCGILRLEGVEGRSVSIRLMTELLEEPLFLLAEGR